MPDPDRETTQLSRSDDLKRGMVIDDSNPVKLSEPITATNPTTPEAPTTSTDSSDSGAS